MGRITRLTLALATLAVFASPALINAQAMSSDVPFKVGTFGIEGEPTVGLVLRDALIIDVAAANTALEVDPMYPHIDAPEDMLELIGQYEYGLKYRLYEIVNNVVRNDLSGAAYVHRVDDVDILAPIQYPSSQFLYARVRGLQRRGFSSQDSAETGGSRSTVPLPQAHSWRGHR